MGEAAELLLVVNPVSGRGRARRWADRVQAWLEREGRAFRRLEGALPSPLHVAAGSERAPLECWVFGGDGTLNRLLEAAAGIRVRIALFPTGTGNVVARDLGVPLDFEGALRVAQAGAPRRFDVGRVGRGRFGFMVSAGLDAEITRRVAEARRGAMHWTDWPRAAIAARRAPEPPFAVAIDDAPPEPARYAAVFNGRHYAGPFRVCPQARSDDGLLDVLRLTEPIGPRWARVAFAFARGRAGSLPDATWTRARRVRLEGIACSQIDGDPGPAGTLEIGIEPAAVEVRAPPM